MLKFRDVNWEIARYALSKDRWAAYPDGADILVRLIDQRRADGDIVWHVLSRESWASHPRALELLERIIALGTVDSHIDVMLAGYPYWARRPELVRACGGEVPTVAALRARADLHPVRSTSCGSWPLRLS